ncbi:hypothetical protein C4J81_16515 [Deltaproteobacteria bacterium Smac51]|nr:hypothetical protein C4J81_16515 [Deltaproteobacteria bacterium Smac51]
MDRNGPPLPTVENKFIDPENRITYRVMAYRRLTRQELLLSVGIFHQKRDKRRKLKPGTIIEIISLIGLRDTP